MSHQTHDKTLFREQLSIESDRILDWWMLHTLDTQYGGFIGRMDGLGAIDSQADKGIILNTRILWAFSAAARHTPNAGYRQCADRAYAYLLRYFWDDLEGGFFWMLDYQGRPVETKKQVYAQAFAIYALSEYYLLTHHKEALHKTQETFALIEQYSFDKTRNGYFEAFSRDWQPLDDLRLSAKDANEAKTMNTHLHVLEAYTNLLRIEPNRLVSNALENLLNIFATYFIDPETGHQHLFFDENWQLKSTVISFGHDIECGWLLTDAAEVLGNATWLQKSRQLALQTAEATLARGVDGDGGILNEADVTGLTDTDKHWWPQAEAIVGFLNAWQITGELRFYTAAAAAWGFIQRAIMDPNLGEWRWRVNRAGVPDTTEDKVSQWKCPYHNVRACLEGMQRLHGAAVA